MAYHNQIAEDNGWLYFDSCNCGIYRVEYRNKNLPNLTLYIFPRQKTFVVKYRGSTTKIPATKLDSLNKILTELQCETC